MLVKYLKQQVIRINVSLIILDMKKLKFQSIIMALCLVMTAGFWSCNDEDVDNDGPMLEVLPSTLSFGDQVSTQTLTVKANREWTATFVESGIDWVSITPDKGSGEGTINVTVLANPGAERVANLKITSSINSATIRITQVAAGGSVVEGDALYQENCGSDVYKINTSTGEADKDGGRWPYIDQYTQYFNPAWEKGGTLDQSGVEYEGSNSNVSNSGALFAPPADGPFSGAPYVGMNTPSSVFEIKNINITGKTNFTFKFGAVFQENYSGGSVLGAITENSFVLEASIDGTNWSPLSYSVAQQMESHWYMGSTEFKVPEGSAKLSIRYKTTNLAPSNQGYRFDDFKLYEGGNGELIGQGGGEEPEPGNDGQLDSYPTTVVTSFAETFDAVENNKVFISDQWAFWSSDNQWPTEFKQGWYGRIFSNPTKSHIECAPYNSTLSEVVAYAIMSPLNVKDATNKILKFQEAFYYKNSDATKLELVASKDFEGNVKTATWMVVKDLTFPTSDPQNTWMDQRVDLGGNYGNDTKVYFAFRYTGKDITYRVTDVLFNAEAQLTFNTPEFSATTFVKDELITEGKITIPYENAKGTESYNITINVSGTAANGITVDAVNNHTLTSGEGVIEIPVKGTPTVAGEVIFTINGIEGLSDNTVTVFTQNPIYLSNVSLPNKDNSSTATYSASIKIDGAAYSGLKLGTGSNAGSYTTEALSATDNLTLSFYAVGWKGKQGKIKITVNNGGTIDGAASKTFDLQGNNGATGNSPFTITFIDANFYSVNLQGITTATTLTFESVKETGLDPRAVLTGVKVQ